MRIFNTGTITLVLLLSVSTLAVSQDEGSSRGSIPEELLRPRRSEAPRYPVDIVIGELGQGNASAAAYNFANNIAAGLLSGRMEHPALASINPVIRESYLTTLSIIRPLNFRIGSGRTEPDGAVSFLVRFIGRDLAVTGELYIRFISTTGQWVFEEMLLEEPRDRDTEQQQAAQRLDYFPYERFY
jgi:hypothetical protein